VAKKKIEFDESFLEAFLGPVDEEDPIELPTGEMSSGFVGPINAAVLYRFWSEEKIDQADWLEEDETRLGFTSRATRGGSYFYYFRNREEGQAAAEYVGAYAPRKTWRFELPVSQCINIAADDPESVFGTTISGDISITTLGSKYRHEFHLLALPAAINALAMRTGILKETSFDLGKLMAGTPVTDEFQLSMIGNGNDNYQDSEMWKQREALWWALEEDNAMAYNPIGAGTKYDTESELLMTMLGIVFRPWTKRVWGKLLRVPDPRVDAQYEVGDSDSDSTRMVRPNLLLLTEIYADKAAAIKAVEEEGGTVAQSATVEAAKSKPPKGEPEEKEEGLAVPDDWVGFGDEWKDELKQAKEAVEGKLPKAPKLKEMAEELSCTPTDIKAWWEEV